jgi:hypothetical protein
VNLVGVNVSKKLNIEVEKVYMWVWNYLVEEKEVLGPAVRDLRGKRTSLVDLL